MVSPLLREGRGVVALPDWPITVQGGYIDGVLWDPGAVGPVIEALHAVSRPPTLQDTDLGPGGLSSAAPLGDPGTRSIDGTSIFGGNLIKHFGHFLHECLGRLWWLGDPGGLPEAAREPAGELRARLQQDDACVSFFVSRWLEPTRELASYMEEVLEGLQGRVLDALLTEGLSSGNDWESHNLAAITSAPRARGGASATAERADPVPAHIPVMQ